MKRILLLWLLFQITVGYPDLGKWDLTMNQDDSYVGVSKALYKGSKVFITIFCESSKSSDVHISWILRQTPCWEEYLSLGNRVTETILFNYYEHPDDKTDHYKKVQFVRYPPHQFHCQQNIMLEEVRMSQMYEKDVAPAASTQSVLHETEGITEVSTLKKGTVIKRSSKTGASGQQLKQIKKVNKTSGKEGSEDPGGGDMPSILFPHNSTSGQLKTEHPVFTIPHDGVFLLVVHIEASQDKPNFNATVHIEMKGDYGYLSAVDWPLLIFYGTMCLLYVVLGLSWLLVSFCQWRDLLRIQFWIGGVILLGMLEKALFYAEYQHINSTGKSINEAVVFAELVSCAKRTLARMLVIIVSLGFGIVKPRLGPMLHRVVGIGGLYFVVAAIEGCLRVLRPKNDPSNQALLATIPLAVLDSAICWWILSSLIQTTRTLRLRRNVVKLSLYRHFTNTLIFAVLASVAFMLWSIKYHRLADCLTDWKELWVDEAYWHLLFSVILIVIMILWRPTNNNSRYAFTPLLDAADDEDEEEPVINDAFDGMKMRSVSQGSSSPKSPKSQSNTLEDDLKWMDENIPSAVADTALPILDSDEEIMTTKFEMSKME